MSYVVSKEQCPMCAKLGKDISQDNLAVYNDGHKWCYACKYSELANGITRFKQKNVEDVKESKTIITLPADCDIIYPEKALQWIKQYELSKVDLLNNNVMWSESMQRLIFPIYVDGWLIAWQGRYFGNQSSAIAKVPKWFGKGNLKNTFNILGKGKTLILTEDIVSAIKVAKCGVMAMPLYGCVVGTERFKRLYKLLEQNTKVRVWLDPDKRAEAIIEAKVGRLCGLHCTTIFSDKDPKEISYDELKTILV